LKKTICYKLPIPDKNFISDNSMRIACFNFWVDEKFMKWGRSFEMDEMGTLF